MSSRSALILVVGLVLGALVVACGTRREPDVEPSARGQSGDAAAAAPPGVKKDAKVRFAAVANHPAGAYWQETGVVVEVKGNWVLMRFKVGQTGAGAGYKDKEVWVNFNTLVWYQIE